MHKLLPLIALVVTAISVGRPAAGELRFAGPLSHPFAAGAVGRDATLVLVAGKGGGSGVGGGTATGGMGGGAATGGMGGGATTGGMGGGAATGGIGGGAFGGGMLYNPVPSFGTSSSDWPGSSTQSSYYTYQCVTPAGQCSFVAPASLRASSLRAGARCSCSDGLSQGQIK